MILLWKAISVQGQGHLDFIKDQPYLKYDIDCDCRTDECYSSLWVRYCANLALQKSDSILKLYYDSLLTVMTEFEVHFKGDAEDPDSNAYMLKTSFIRLQENWRQHRSAHCKLYWPKDGNSNHYASIYMNCMRYLTELRIQDLVGLLTYYKSQMDSFLEENESMPIHYPYKPPPFNIKSAPGPR